MQRFFVGFAMVLAASAGMAAAEDEEGFVSLFDGETLSGWTVWGDPAGFEVVDGVIRSEIPGIGYGMYYHERTFSDFELRLAFRVPDRGNSGVFIRFDKEGPPETNHPWVSAYEVQISQEQPPRADIHTTGALYGYQPVDPRPEYRPDEWREMIVRCVGPEITVWIDGVRTTHLDQSTREETRDKALSGYIGVQDNHGPADTYVEFRDIRIKDLSDSAE